MDALFLGRMQFAATTIYHFFFVPLTLGLSIFVAVCQTAYYRSGNEEWKKLTQFWGKLFLINFAMGVVTGIVQEFQFGMNWAEYSRFVGDIFGAPLAVEALVAFFLESTFIGLWVFGWDKLSKRVHLMCIWIVAISSNLSAFWILVANSWMQHPVGYVLDKGKPRMDDFFALIGNPTVWVQFPHVFFSGLCTAAFFVLGISAWHLLRDRPDRPLFLRAFKLAGALAVVASLLVMLSGHRQGQHTAITQPMKMAATEALWNSENPAAFSLFTVGNEKERRDVWALRIPGMLSFLSFNQFTGEVKGINELQKEYEMKYGPGDYVPPVALTYWSFRAMAGAGILMFLLSALALWYVLRGKAPSRLLLRVLIPALLLPTLATATGWMVTELGRQPWIVFGLLKTADGVSKHVSAGMVGASLAIFVALYGALMVADVWLLRKYAILGIEKSH